MSINSNEQRLLRLKESRLRHSIKLHKIAETRVYSMDKDIPSNLRIHAELLIEGLKGMQEDINAKKLDLIAFKKKLSGKSNKCKCGKSICCFMR